jgi:hypothetical protein
VKLFTILYANDTVLLAESVAELHSELNYFYEYCEKWNLKVNTNKSKVMFLSNKSNTLTDKVCTLPLFKMSYIALDAFSARLILFFLKDPVL